MQETRRYILEILKEHDQATVDDIVDELRKRRGDITAVTVRHHLSRLQEEGFVTSPQLRHRNTPGRPQHIYALTDKAAAQFPNNYQRLAAGLMTQLEARLPENQVNVILEGVAENLAAGMNVPEGPLSARMDSVVQFLNQQGYEASWECCDEGYLLHTCNCPYNHISKDSSALCDMDMRLISRLLGVVPRLVSRISAGDATCSYMVPNRSQK